MTDNKSGGGPLVEGEIIKDKLSNLQQQHDDEDSSSIIEQQLQQALENHQELMSHTADNKDKIIESLTQIRNYYHELQWWHDALQTESTLLDYVSTDKTKADCFGRMGRYYVELGKLHHAKRSLEASLEILLELHGPNVFDAELGRTYNDLARVELEQGHWDIQESLPYLQQAEDHYRHHGKTRIEVEQEQDDETSNDNDKSILDKHDTEDSIELSKILKNQALLYRINNSHDLALQKYQEALQLVGSDQQQTLEIQVSIADCLHSLDQLEDSFQQYQNVLDSMAENQQEPSPLEGVLRHNLGVIHSKQGRHTKALKEFQLAYELKRATLGESHPEVCTTLNGLGAVHASQQNKGEALSYFRQALLIARVNAGQEGENNEQVQHALRNIALIQGDLQRTNNSRGNSRGGGGYLP